MLVSNQFWRRLQGCTPAHSTVYVLYICFQSVRLFLHTPEVSNCTFSFTVFKTLHCRWNRSLLCSLLFSRHCIWYGRRSSDTVQLFIEMNALSKRRCLITNANCLMNGKYTIGVLQNVFIRERPQHLLIHENNIVHLRKIYQFALESI